MKTNKKETISFHRVHRRGRTKSNTFRGIVWHLQVFPFGRIISLCNIPPAAKYKTFRNLVLWLGKPATHNTLSHVCLIYTVCLCVKTKTCWKKKYVKKCRTMLCQRIRSHMNKSMEDIISQKTSVWCDTIDYKGLVKCTTFKGWKHGGLSFHKKVFLVWHSWF